jgi:CRP/FNR family transcriptional regulator
MNKVKILRENNLFKGMDERTINILANISETISVPSETVIFAEGMQSDAMFIIASGKVDVIKDTMDKNESVIGELSTGDVLGILSLFQNGDRAVTVKAKEPVELITITKENFDKLVKNNIHAAYQVLLSITQYFTNLLNGPEGLKEMIQ